MMKDDRESYYIDKERRNEKDLSSLIRFFGILCLMMLITSIVELVSKLL